LTVLEYAKQARQRKIVEYLLGVRKTRGVAIKVAPPARPTGVASFNTDDSCVLVAGTVEAVAGALQQRFSAKVWEKNVHGQKVKLTRRCYAVFRIIDQPFTAIMRLNCAAIRHYLRIPDAQGLSQALQTRAIFVANSDTASMSQYAVFDSGKLVELFDSFNARGLANRSAVVAQFASVYGLDLKELPGFQLTKGKLLGSTLRRVKLAAATNDLEFVSRFLKQQKCVRAAVPGSLGAGRAAHRTDSRGPGAR
jgi:hypothetical protein